MRFERIAKQFALKSDHDIFKHSALIVKGSNIISIGFNKGIKHAEISAIGIHGPRRYSGSILYSFRFNRTGLANSRPCNRCRIAIVHAGIQRVVYFSNGSIIQETI